MTVRWLSRATALAATASILLAGCASSGSAPAAPTTSDVSSTEAPTPTDTGGAAIKSVTYKGSGSKDLKIEKPETGLMLITTTIKGTGRSTVYAVDYAGLGRDDLLVDAVGDYHGTTLFDIDGRIDTQHLKVDVDGTWVITLSDFQTARKVETSAEGSLDDVLMYEGSAPVNLSFTSITGQGKVTVTWMSTTGITTVVNDAGKFTADATLTDGLGLLKVSSHGAWELELSPA